MWRGCKLALRSSSNKAKTSVWTHASHNYSAVAGPGPRAKDFIDSGGVSVWGSCERHTNPSLNPGIGRGDVPTEFAITGKPVEIEIRGKRTGARILPKPIYRQIKPD